MPIQGFVRYRKHLFGRQPAFNTLVPATRAYPFRGTPTDNRNWTDPDIDVGSIDPVAPPYLVAPDITAPLTDAALAYNNIPLLMSAIFGGEVAPTGGGTAQTWVHEPQSTTPDPIDTFTYEFGDDVLTDWFQFGDGILESLEITGPDGLGPLTTSMGWRFGSAYNTGSTDYPVNNGSGDVVPTAGLGVSVDDAIVYLKDGAIFIASDAGDLATSQITDALHTFTLRINQETDQKRFANGDQSFDIDAYGRGARSIELECTWAKTADTVGLGSEADAWMSDTAVNRFVRLQFTSKVLAQAPSTYHSWTIDLPMRYYTRTEGEIGGNTTVILTGHAYFDPTAGSGDLPQVFSSTVVNTLTEAELGLAGS